MKLISKQKLRLLKMKSEEKCYGKDLISLMPDAIICEILTLLPTEEAVRSSILSQRWRHVWKYVPVIEISDEICTLDSEWKFHRFVNNVLTHNSIHCLKKFSLSCENQFSLSPVRSWIKAAFMRDIETLDLDISNTHMTHTGLGFVDLPLNLLTCNKVGNLGHGNFKLENLWLRFDIKLNVSPTAYLPSLRNVYLYQVSLLDSDSLENLLAGCPVLEELEIDRREDEIITLFVKSSSLKKLRVCTFERDHDINYIFDARNLEEITFCIEVPPNIVGSSLSSLVTARLDYSCMDADEANSAFMSLRKLSNVKHLYLYLGFLKVLVCSTHLDNLFTFPNLTYLEVHIFCCCLPFMCVLLGCLPLLTSLVIDKEENGCDVTRFHQGFQTPECTMSCLESIEFFGVEGHGDEMAMVRYFLMNSPVLKKICICLSITSPSKISKVHDLIFRFPKISSNVQIVFL